MESIVTAKLTSNEMWKLLLEGDAVLQIPLEFFGGDEAYSGIYDLANVIVSTCALEIRKWSVPLHLRSHFLAAWSTP